jgi:hypothetical protein
MDDIIDNFLINLGDTEGNSEDKQWWWQWHQRGKIIYIWFTSCIVHVSGLMFSE